MATQTATNDEKHWQEAESLARAYIERSGEKVESVERVRALPYFVNVGFVGYGGAYVLVFGGKVLDQEGVHPLGDYLRASNFLTRRDVDTKLFHYLVGYFHADPPASRNAGYYSDSSRPELCPRLIWDGDGGARFVLDYVVTASPPFGGSRADADEIDVEEWTLHIPQSYEVAWQSKTFKAHR
jgi:hypothetical protein